MHLRRGHACTVLSSLGLVLALVVGTANADPSRRSPGSEVPSLDQPLSLNDLAPQDEGGEMGSSETTTETTTTTTVRDTGFRGIGDFFNIREANPNLAKGMWAFEVTGEWITHSDGSDDHFSLQPSIRYALTDRTFVELDVLELNLGDGDRQGNGDLQFTLFSQCIEETDTMPAMASWIELRIPTGEASSGVDGTLHLNFTKTITDRFRAHMEGFVQTANGERGGQNEDRRHFQWGIGPGFDCQVDEKTIAVLNYLHRSSEFDGVRNQNIIELGAKHEIAEHQYLSFAVDVGLDGAGEAPNLASKLQWLIQW